jgi:hypothetical protein
MIIEDRVDDLLREWARRNLDAAPDVAVPVAADVGLVAVETASRHPHPRERRWLVAASVILIAAVAVLGLAVTRTSDHTASDQSTTILGTWRDYSAEASLIFGDGVVTVSGAREVCGPQTYAVGFDGGRLTLRTLGSPFVCSPPGQVIPERGTPAYERYQLRAKAADRFEYVLHHTPSWHIDGHVLTLTAPNGPSIQLSNTLAR